MSPLGGFDEEVEIGTDVCIKRETFASSGSLLRRTYRKRRLAHMSKLSIPNRVQVGSYWREMFASAWNDTELFSRGKILTTLGISVIAFGLQWGIGVRTLYVTLQIIGTVLAAYLIVALGGYVWNIIRAPAIRQDELSREAEELRERLKPQLDIAFDETNPEFIDTAQVADRRGGSWRGKLYRVAVTSRSTSASVRLKIDRAQ